MDNSEIADAFAIFRDSLKMAGAFKDTNWLKEMIKHHEMAIAMSEEAKSKATHDELKALADQIIKAQSAEIVKMRAMIKEWSK